MIALLSEGFLLGLSLGTTCLVTCAPVYAPILMHRQRSLKAGISAVMELSLGRFISYASFGMISGWLGNKLNSLIEIDFFVIISYIFVAIYLLYTAFISGKRETGLCPAHNAQKLSGSPFIIGLITGLSLCPAFLGALTRGFDSGGVIGGLMLFIGFFIGTTLYVLPFSFLSYFTKKRIFRLVGVFASILVACYFLYLGSIKIFDRYNSFIFNFTNRKITLILSENISGLQQEAQKHFNISQTLTIQPDNLKKTLLTLPEKTTVLYLSKTPPSPIIENLVREQKIYFATGIINSKKHTITQIHTFLDAYSFKARHTRGFFYQIPAP